MLFDDVYRELWFCHVRTCMHSLCTRVVHSRNVMQEYRIKRRLILNAPIATKVVCFSRLLKCLRSLYGKQYGPRSDCSYRSSLFWVHTICFYTSFVSNARQLFAADNFSRRHFQMHIFLAALTVKCYYQLTLCMLGNPVCFFVDCLLIF